MACSLAWVSGSLFGVSARDLFLVRFLSINEQLELYGGSEGEAGRVACFP